MSLHGSGSLALKRCIKATLCATGALVVCLSGEAGLAAPAKPVAAPRVCAPDATPAALADDEGAGSVWQKWQRGLASWYGNGFHNRRTASGETFNTQELTAAHRTLPFGTQVKVRNPNNDRTVVVRINDRGPFSGGRSIDLSKAAASALGILNRGTAQVELLIESSMGTAVAQTAREAGKACGPSAD